MKKVIIKCLDYVSVGDKLAFIYKEYQSELLLNIQEYLNTCYVAITAVICIGCTRKATILYQARNRRASNHRVSSQATS